MNALGGQSGGAVVLNARTGDVLAIAGSAYSSPQPPGSTFKVITTTAALEGHDVKLSDTFPVLTEINPDPSSGARVVHNAHDEACGGNFTTAFAESCNSVFAPLGVKVGAQRLVDTAERYGFNQTPSLYNARATAATQPNMMTIPSAKELKNEPTNTDLSVTAFGQGKVLATPLGMASVAQAVAHGGLRSPTSMVKDPNLKSSAKPVQVTSKDNARVLTGLMRAVVTQGTGVAANLPGVEVAGKTGTAELGPKPGEPPPPPGQEDTAKQLIDGWFIAFAPARKPKLAVAVMLIDASGDGGTTAAPIAREISSGRPSAPGSPSARGLRHPERHPHHGHAAANRGDQAAGRIQRQAERHADQRQHGATGDHRPPVDPAGARIGRGGGGEDGADHQQDDAGDAAGDAEQLDQRQGSADAADHEQRLELGLPHQSSPPQSWCPTRYRG